MKLLLSILLLFTTIKGSVNELSRIEVKPIEPIEFTINLTAYYTPVISVKDYGVNGVSIKYKGKALLLYFPKGGIEVIKREGFGICHVDTETLKGTFILDSNLTLQPYVKGSEGNRLKRFEVATDNNFIPHNSTIHIPKLNLTTKSKDVGGKINGNDVDLYLGQGSISEMEKLSYKYTGKFKARII